MRSGAVLLLLLAQGAAQPAPSPLGAAATASKTEFFKARDKLMAFWCANGQHAESAPCKASALIQKVRAEKDTEKKKKVRARRAPASILRVRVRGRAVTVAFDLPTYASHRPARSAPNLHDLGSHTSAARLARIARPSHIDRSRPRLIVAPQMLADRSAEQKALTPEARKDAKAAGAAMYTAFCAENKDSAECASPMVRAMYAPSSKGTGVPKSTGISKRTVVPKPKTVPA